MGRGKEKRRNWGLAVFALVATCMAAAFGWDMANRHFAMMSERYLDNNLSLAETALQSEIARFDALPAVLREDQRVIAVLSDPDNADVNVLRSYLMRIRDHAGVSGISVFDSMGNVIASSDWHDVDDASSQNYAFRPFFIDAMANGSGRFYAVGVKSGIPGYYLASRVNLGPRPAGVVLVKVDFSPIVASWRKNDIEFALADKAGIVFLSTIDDWRYRSLGPLASGTLANIERTRQYGDIDLAARPPLFTASKDRVEQAVSLVEGGLLFRMRPFGDDGWRLIAVLPFNGLNIGAGMAALVAALMGLVISAGVLIYRQRGQLIEVKNEQSAVLERRVEERTRELTTEMVNRLRAEQDLRTVEDELMQAAKLATLGQMSTALAHEVSQPITALAATLTATERRLAAAETDVARGLVEQAQGLVRRLQHIIRYLRSFARKERGDDVRMDIGVSIVAALELAEAQAREVGVSIVASGLDKPVEFIGNPVRLEQVLINLVVNALDAVAGRDSRAVGIDLLSDDRMARILVWDTGPGMPEGFDGKIVAPFFTTKSGEQGLGLGLSISQSILAEFGAHMQFRKREGGGTVCEVHLPLAQEQEKIEAAE